MSGTPPSSSQSSLSASDESKFVPRSSIVNEASLAPNHFGGGPMSATEEDAPSARIPRGVLPDDDGESGIVGATIVFTPEPSLSSLPGISLKDDSEDALPRSAIRDIPAAPLVRPSLAASDVGGGSGNQSSQFIGTIVIDSTEDGGTDDSHSRDGSTSTEYEMLNAADSTKASSKSVLVQNAAECPAARNDRAAAADPPTEHENDPRSSPTAAELDEFLRDIEREGDATSLPSTLPSLHSREWESPAPFQTPLRFSDEREPLHPHGHTHHSIGPTPGSDGTRGVVVRDSPNDHRSDVSSLHSSSVGEFSAMTRSMIRRIRRTVKGNDAGVDSSLVGGKEETPRVEQGTPSFSALKSLWETKTLWGVTGRTLFREDTSANGQGSSGGAAAATSSSGKDLEDGETKPSALFSDEVAASGTSTLGRFAGEGAKDTHSARSSSEESCPDGTRRDNDPEDAFVRAPKRDPFEDASDLTTRELLGEVARVGIHFVSLLLLLAFSPLVRAWKMWRVFYWNHANASQASHSPDANSTSSDKVRSTNRSIGTWLVVLVVLLLGVVFSNLTDSSDGVPVECIRPLAQDAPRTSSRRSTDAWSCSILLHDEIRRSDRESIENSAAEGSTPARTEEESSDHAVPDPWNEPEELFSDALIQASFEVPTVEPTVDHTEEPVQEPLERGIIGESIAKTSIVASSGEPAQELIEKCNDVPTERIIEVATLGSAGDRILNESTEEALEAPLIEECIVQDPLEDVDESTKALDIINGTSDESKGHIREPSEDCNVPFQNPVSEPTGGLIEAQLRTETLVEVPVQRPIPVPTEYQSKTQEPVGVYFGETESQILDNSSVIVVYPEDATNDDRDSAFGRIFAALASTSIILFCLCIARSKTHVKEQLSRQEPPTMNKRMWTHTENDQFFRGVKQYGTDWEKVAVCIPTRTLRQVISKGRYWVRIGSPPEMKRCKREPDGSSHSEASDTTTKVRNTVVREKVKVVDIEAVEGLAKCITPRSSTRKKKTTKDSTVLI